MNHAAAARTPD